MFDINNFKNINRFYGHQFGDITLLELVSCVKSAVGQEEVFGRIKGGTFAIVLRETEKEACKKAKEIIDVLENFKFSIVKDLKCTFVVKTVISPTLNAEEIIYNLEKELRKCKNNNQLFRC